MYIIAGLVDAQLPAWTSALFTAAGMILMALYQHVLDRRGKRTDHALQKEAIHYEKQLAFVQERHKKRLDALDALGAALLEFDHAVRHVRRGNKGYIAAMLDYSGKARTLGREAEGLLGPAAYEAVLTWTDAGLALLNASFLVTERTVSVAQARGFPQDHLASLHEMIGTKHAVRDAGVSLFAHYDEELRTAYREIVLEASGISAEFNERVYEKAFVHFQTLRDEITRTLPTPPN